MLLFCGGCGEICLYKDILLLLLLDKNLSQYVEYTYYYIRDL
jgi:hypothetical protein